MLMKAITYFGTIQAVYTLSSCSQKRWGNIRKAYWLFTSWHIWHLMVRSSWESERICCSPSRGQDGFYRHAKAEFHSKNQEWNLRSYRLCQSCGKVIQAIDATLDMEVGNIESFLAQLVPLWDSWEVMWDETKLVAFSLQIEVKLSRKCSTTVRKRTRFHDEDTADGYVDERNEADESSEDAYIRKHIFYVVLDNVVTVRFTATKQISDILSFLWNYQKTSEEELNSKAAK